MKRFTKKILASVLITVLIVSMFSYVSLAGETEGKDNGKQNVSIAGESAKYSVGYSSHVQNIGWQEEKFDGDKSGTSSLALRLEGIRINVYDVSGEDPAPVEDAISYSVHVQNIGWMNNVSNGDIAGTSGRSLRLEAIKISLSEELAKAYDIFYCVHAQNYGDLGWAKNGELAGTEGMALRLEAIRIQILPKGTEPDKFSNLRSFYSTTDKGDVTYQAHVQNKGWMTSVSDGAVAGTKGEAKRVEAIKIWLDKKYDESGAATSGIYDETGNFITGGIEYSAHVQNKGWMSYVSEGQIAGTSGEALRIEALKIRLTGDLATKYHVYYKVHIQNFGDMGWAMDDEVAGSEGYGSRVESIEIRICKNGSESAPSQEARSGLCNDYIGDLSLSAHVMGEEDYRDPVSSNEICGTVGEGKALDSIKLSVDTSASKAYTGGISYRVHVADEGWLESVSDGAAAGSGKMIQAVKISLDGELATYCDVLYQAQIANYGWLNWTKNGGSAGSEGFGYRLEALRVKIVPKGSVSVSGVAFLNNDGKFTHPCPGGTLTSEYGYRAWDNSQHNGLDFAIAQGSPIYAAYYGTIVQVGCGSLNGNYIYMDNGNGIITKYLHCSAIYVSVGQVVYRGQVIAAVGSTGYSTGPHLHYQVEQYGTPVNPWNYL